MNKLDLDAIRARAEAATAGPWGLCCFGLVDVIGPEYFDETGNDTNDIICRQSPQPKNLTKNFDFIAHARTDIPRLLDEVERLRAVCRKAITYDDAIRSCANEPEKMASFCTFQGDDLDNLYLDLFISAREALGDE